MCAGPKRRHFTIISNEPLVRLHMQAPEGLAARAFDRSLGATRSHEAAQASLYQVWCVWWRVE
jgi:hypothetical protein